MPHELLSKILPSLAEASKEPGKNVVCKLSKDESEKTQTFLYDLKVLAGIHYETIINPLGIRIKAIKGAHDE